MDNTTETCLVNKVGCQIHAHICGADNVWNLRNAMRYIQYSLADSTNEAQKKMWDTASSLLKGNNLETLLLIAKPFCPEKSKYCGPVRRERRDIGMEKKTVYYNESDKVYVRRKRLFDPPAMMRLFNKVVCDKEIMAVLADFWDTHYLKLGYSRVWIMNVGSDIWCCLVHNLEKSYDKVEIQ